MIDGSSLVEQYLVQSDLYLKNFVELVLLVASSVEEILELMFVLADVVAL